MSPMKMWRSSKSFYRLFCIYILLSATFRGFWLTFRIVARFLRTILKIRDIPSFDLWEVRLLGRIDWQDIRCIPLVSYSQKCVGLALFLIELLSFSITNFLLTVLIHLKRLFAESENSSKESGNDEAPFGQAGSRPSRIPFFAYFIDRQKTYSTLRIRTVLLVSNGALLPTRALNCNTVPFFIYDVYLIM